MTERRMQMIAIVTAGIIVAAVLGVILTAFLTSSS